MVLRLLFALALGVMVGGFVGLALTGDWVYTVVSVVALAVAALLAVVLVAMRVRRGSGGASGRRRNLRWIATGVLVVIGLAAVLVPVIAALASGRLDNPVNGTHQKVAMSGIAAAAGTSTVTELDLFPDYVLADIVNPPGHRTVDEWTYQFGRAEDDGPEVVPPTDVAGASFDMKTIDMTHVVSDIAAAEKTAKMTSPSDVHLGIRREPDDGNAPQVSVFLTDKYDDATVVFDLSGKILHRFGSVFG
ncbi:MAG TPA: hypothetical protein VGM70_04810 [Pseudolysinimonas sp.]|jgi:NADH:ubiquinone oxidoreductase subunit 6 (subunit J)